jgi:hypothetical protein
MIETDSFTILDRSAEAPPTCDLCGEPPDGALYRLDGLCYCGACLRALVDDMTDEELAEALGGQKEYR